MNPFYIFTIYYIYRSQPLPPLLFQHTLQDRPISGEHFVAVHVDKVGGTEQLNPLLVGLSNMAISYLPVGYKLDSVQSATREVVRGVRYNLLVNALNDKSEPLVCQIEVLEKPWVLLQWGEKLRTLIYTNCTAEQYGAVAANEEKYSGFINPVFVNNGAMDEDALKNVDGQIVPAKPIKQPAAITNFDDLLKQLTGQILVTTTHKSQESTSTSIPIVYEADSTSEADILPLVITTPQTNEILPLKPLDDASKSLLDDFFNVDINYRSSNSPLESQLSAIALDNSNQEVNAESNLSAVDVAHTNQEIKPNMPNEVSADVTINKTENVANEQNLLQTQNQHKEETVQISIDNKDSKEIRNEGPAPAVESAPIIEGVSLTISHCANSSSIVHPEPTSSETTDHQHFTSESPRSKRHTSSSESAYIQSIARKALRQLDSVDSDDFKRILLDVLRTNREDLPKSTTNYVLALRVANSHCIENDADEADDDLNLTYDECSMNLVAGSTKICNVEVNLMARHTLHPSKYLNNRN